MSLLQLQQYFDQFANETHPFEPFKCRAVNESITYFECVSYWREPSADQIRRKRTVTHILFDDILAHQTKGTYLKKGKFLANTPTVGKNQSNIQNTIQK